MTCCDSPPPLQWTSFATLPPRNPLCSPPPSPLDSEASSTLSDSLILITPEESSLLPDKDNVGIYNYVPSTESKPSPSLICDSPELLPYQISVALKDELPALSPRASVASKMLDRFLADPACDLSDEVETTEQFSVAHGGFSDIYKGVWARPFGGEKGKTVVAIKLLRAFKRQEVDHVRARKRLNREVYVWNGLLHPNIARFYGISFRLGGRPSLVMQWYQNGTVPDYIDTQLRTNGVEVDRLSLIRDIAQGLGYLHSLIPPVVHGDLKGNNTLVNDDGRAMLTDFGLSKVMEELTGPTGDSTSTCAGSVRWQAPELIFDTRSGQGGDRGAAPKPSSPTRASDIWSFGCTVYEIMTGKIPYHTRLHDWTVIQAIMEKQYPVHQAERGVLEGSGLMSLLQDCWQYDAKNRPEIREVLRRL